MQERESIRLKRLAGEDPPWTDDPILQMYRFTNIRRMDDKVSRWLQRTWYVPFRDHPNILGAVLLARFLNYPNTLQEIGFPEKWNVEHIRKILHSRSARNLNNFNSAYVAFADNRREGQSKVDTILDVVINPIVVSNLTINTHSMEQTWLSLIPFHGMANFMAGQIVADLRWAVTGNWSDSIDWAPICVGSSRGMKRLHNMPMDVSMQRPTWYRLLRELILNLKALNPSLMSRLEAFDVQNCLCEFSKYEKTVQGQGKPKQRYDGTRTPATAMRKRRRG